MKMLVGSGGPLRVWHDGRLVHEHAGPRRPRADEDECPLRLHEGWNTVLVKVVSAGPDHGLYLRFTGGDGLRLALRREK